MGVVANYTQSKPRFDYTQKGNQLFLGVSGPDNIHGDGFWGPYTDLMFDGSEKMQKFSFQIKFNDSNNFSGVILNGKQYNLRDWNAQFTKLDPRMEGTGTNVGSSGVKTDY